MNEPPPDPPQSCVVDRRLHLLRHAKSSWDDPGLDDHDRPLAPRGRRAVKVLAGYLRDSEIEPQLVLCSPSRRTLETLEGISPTGDRLIEPALFSATCGELIDRLHALPATLTEVMVIGHNPTLQMVALKLAAGGNLPQDSGPIADLQRKFPTGALASLRFAGAWSELRPGCAELDAYVRPKALLYQ
jgi:phosphohistidine phosphatase